MRRRHTARVVARGRLDHARPEPGGTPENREGRRCLQGCIRRAGIRQSQEHYPSVFAGRTKSSRPLGPEGKRPGQGAQRLQGNPHEDSWRSGDGGAAQVRAGYRQADADSLDELYADRPLQSHGGDLSDADRVHGGQGQSFGPARAAFARRTSPILAAISCVCVRPKCRCFPT